MSTGKTVVVIAVSIAALTFSTVAFGQQPCSAIEGECQETCIEGFQPSSQGTCETGLCCVPLANACGYHGGVCLDGCGAGYEPLGHYGCPAGICCRPVGSIGCLALHGECMEGCASGTRDIGQAGCFDATCCIPEGTSCADIGGTCQEGCETGMADVGGFGCFDSTCCVSPTACITDIRADALSRHVGFLDAEVTLDDLVVQSMADLNEDGQSEQVVRAESWCGTSGNCLHVYYLSGECITYGGAYFYQLESLVVLPEISHGLHNIQYFGDDGCAGRQGIVSALAFNGSSYETLHTIECSCPEDDPTATRDPACP